MDFVSADFAGNRWSQPISFMENIYFYSYFYQVLILSGLYLYLVASVWPLKTECTVHAQSKAADINVEALNWSWRKFYALAGCDIA